MATQRAPAFTTQAARPARRHLPSLVTGIIVCVLAAVMLAGGIWALWVDRADRDARGFVTIQTTRLRTGTSAVVSDLKGDGPSWLYGSTVLGTARFRATSRSGHPLFMGIARTSDVSRYLHGAGHATIGHLETGELTTHPGHALSTPPAQVSIWARSTQGTGEQQLLWKQRHGDWSIVLTNADASAGVALRGDVSAKAPLLPWMAGGLLLATAVFALVGAWLLVRGIRREPEAPPPARDGWEAPGSARVHVEARG